MRASKKWSQLFDGDEARVILDTFESKYCNKDWFKLLKSASLGKKYEIKDKNNTFIGDAKQRIHLAFSIAKSSMSNTGQFPDNEAEWRRIEMCLPILENIISDRFSNNYTNFGPIEPLNTIYVSREISGDEYREMNLHCAEDLTSHQYILGELLTERCDFEDNFSLNIPATRYYRKSNTTSTTGEGGKSEHGITLSFAYQIDMEVLEGREVSGSNGMFRPYFECWKEFTKSINKAASQMSQVNMVRLDLKRYYDRLQRYVVQDALRDTIPNDLSKYEDHNLLELVQSDEKDKKSKVIDWLLEQSFGYEKYSPKTGEIHLSDPFVGIPQGPDLSSYLANLVLFKVDSKAREFLERNKEPESERYTAWYARYVDDMVLIAEDTSTLSELRIIIEEAVRELELELVAKEQPMAMTAEEFGVYLTQGKALASSGPTGNIELVDIEDINFFGRIERYQALALLNNKDLYSDELSSIKSKLNMAVHCSQLRFSDLKKVVKWIWFVAVQETESNKPYDLVCAYQDLWIQLVGNMEQQPTPNTCPWEDPLLLAFDGLNQLITRTNSWVNDSLSKDSIQIKEDARKRLIQSINSNLLYFLANKNPQNILGWGVSKTELARTFWQKSINLQWHASQFSDRDLDENKGLVMFSKLSSEHNLKVSLVRTYLTELQLKNELKYNSIESNYSSVLRDFCLLIQIIYLHLSKINLKNNDILSPILGKVESTILKDDYNLTTSEIFSLFIPDREESLSKIDEKVIIKFLYFICSITSDTKLISFLTSRWKKVQSAFLDNPNYILISPLPTVKEQELFGYELDETQKIHSILKVSTTHLNSDSDEEESFTEDNDLYISNDNKNDINHTLWTELKNTPNNLSLKVTNGESLKGANYIFTSPPPIIKDVDKKLLSWSVSTYNSLVECIHKGKNIPTWCNTSMSVIPPFDEYREDNNVCIISSGNRVTSYPQAFIRNGGRSLRPIQVPNHNVSFWQAGVALTDMLGFTRDLDAYAKVDETFEAASESPQSRLLKNSLKKLNGSMYFSKPVFSPNGEMIPKSIKRTLELLENFPDTSDTSDTSDTYLYGFITEMETQVMRLRLSSHINPTENGKLIQMYAEAVKATLARVPLDWFTHLTKVTYEISSPFRYCECFWIVLYNVFKNSFQKSKLNTEVGEFRTITNAILLGCQVNLVEARLKAIVFESQASEKIDFKEFEDLDINDALPEGFFGLDFSLDKYILSVDNEESSIEGLGNSYTRLLKDKATQHSFSIITPLGWFLIALIKRGLVSKGNQNIDRKYREVLARLACSNLVKLLTFESKERLNGFWPFEQEIIEYDIDSLLDELNLFNSISLSKIVNVENEHFEYNSQKDEFKGLWKLKRWQIALAASNTNDNKPFYKIIDNRLVSSWSETYVGDNLVYVSSLGKLYGDILEQVLSNYSPKQNTPLENNSSKISNPISAKKLLDGKEALINKNKQNIDDKKIVNIEDKLGVEVKPSTSDVNTESLSKVLEKLRRINRTSWALRKNDRAPSHSRVAMFQIDLKEKFGDGYYTHYIKNNELLENCTLGVRCKEIREILSSKNIDSLTREALIEEQRGCNNNEKCSELYEELKNFNRAEIRRQALLTGVIHSCIHLGVDLLVLPEYSVQPETIIWLKKFLRGKKISVLAGTYRLPEGYSPSKLKELTSKHYSSMLKDFQSVMTLLVPHEEDKVVCFNRAKKYASPAANELINPYRQEIEPLFTLEMMEKHLCNDFSGEKLGLKDITTLMNTPHISLLGFMQELICAELFLLTNPVNYLNLASEYKNLSNKFGYITTTDNIDDSVEAVMRDITNISHHLSGNTKNQSQSFQSFRRSVVAIPAMTSRKQDYWIFGQGAMLANGISTIFCNSLCGKDSTGGSCFIGLDSWIGDEKQPFITPYNGWSKGIYYGRKADTLEKEQSFVVVDIDPKMMSLGSPRPQALPVPMKLVAHVPVIEIEDKEKEKVSLLHKVVEHLEADYKVHNKALIAPEDTDELINKIVEWVNKACDKDQKNSLNKRITNWKTKWRAHPHVGLASLTDWIAVEVPSLVEGVKKND